MIGKILFFVTFCTIMAISRQKNVQCRDYTLFLLNNFKCSLLFMHGTIDSTAHSIHLYSMEHYIHNGEHPTRPGFELSTSVRINILTYVQFDWNKSQCSELSAHFLAWRLKNKLKAGNAYKSDYHFIPLSAGTDFIRQILTSKKSQIWTLRNN